MDIAIRFDRTETGGNIILPASKSISNRVLIINALADSLQPVRNLSDCDDTVAMLNVLNSNGSCFDIGHAGTAMRFLTAYLQGGEIEIPASVSSQYISALMMIAPYMVKGLKLRLKGHVVSRTYIHMTAAIMRHFGAAVQVGENMVEVRPCPYVPVSFSVESDWSAASYFYEWLAIREEGVICLPGLFADSLQGDAGQVKVWEKLGVQTVFETGVVRLKAREVTVKRLDFDFTEMPDLVQSFVVACCLQGKPFVFSGVETLRIKETDRIAALIEEMARLGFCLKAEGDSKLMWDGSRCAVGELEIATYHDHRMAMAFAPAAWKYPGLVIRDKEVVTKSFPGYWEQFEKLGLVCQTV